MWVAQNRTVSARVLSCSGSLEIHCQQPLSNKHFHAPVTVPLPPRSHRRHIDRDMDSEGLVFRPGVADEIHCQQPLSNKHFHAPFTVPLPPRSHRRRIDRDMDSEGLVFRPGVVGKSTPHGGRVEGDDWWGDWRECNFPTNVTLENRDEFSFPGYSHLFPGRPECILPSLNNKKKNKKKGGGGGEGTYTPTRKQ